MVVTGVSQLPCFWCQIPKSANLDYVLEAAPASATASDSSSIIVFVLDCSGSMCVSQPMRGDIKLRGDHTAQIRDELGALALDEGNQHMPGERGVTYVSRMQAVQAAVSSQIEALKVDVSGVGAVHLLPLRRSLTTLLVPC